MTFRRIDYLEWARTHMGRVKFDLAKSNIKALTKDELGVSLNDAPLFPADEDGILELREILAKKYGRKRSNVLVTGGATMGLYIACAAALKAGDQAVVETPVYEPLLRAAEERGAEIRPLERRFDRGWQIELEELERIISRNTRLVLLTNTHNPSGAATSPEKLLSIGQLARDHGAVVVVSEVYLDNAFTPLKPAAALGPNLVSIGSLSKVYGLGGLRIGWIVGEEGFIARAREVLDYLECELPAPSEWIAAQALKKAGDLVERCRRVSERGFSILREWIEKRDDLEWVEPAGGTVALVRLPHGVDAPALSTFLREKHSTLVVPGDYFGARGFLRLSVGMDEDVLRQGLKNVGKAIDQLKSRRA
ncbi:MAG TPA: pyridoxal phosphate-dependent aminotransferase [Planctomycetota bacterium]